MEELLFVRGITVTYEAIWKRRAYMATADPSKQVQWQKLFTYLLGNQAAWIIDIGLKAGLFRAIAEAGTAGGVSADCVHG